MNFSEYLSMSVICARMFGTRYANRFFSTNPENLIDDDVSYHEILLDSDFDPAKVQFMFLYGNGIIEGKDTLKRYMTNDDAIADIRKCLESCCRSYFNADSHSDKVLKTVFELCMNANYVGNCLKKLDFDTVLDYYTRSEHSSVTVDKGYFHVADEAFFKFLCDIGEKFVNVHTDEGVTVIREIHTKDFPNIDTEHEITAVLDGNRMIELQRFYKKPYAKEFCSYVKEEKKELTEENYNEFIAHKKMVFVITSYKKLHSVCDSVNHTFINHYDYEYRSTIPEAADDLLFDIHTESVIEDKEIHLDPNAYADLTTNELLVRSVQQALKDDVFHDKTVFKVVNMNTFSYFMLSAGEILPIDKEMYVKTLFDFGRIWEAIQAADKDNAIHIIDNKVKVDGNYFMDVPADERVYIKPILNEQVMADRLKVKNKKANRLRRSINSIYEMGRKRAELLNNPNQTDNDNPFAGEE